ncbi:unannotated protein [freshwater metagenome]|uniref:Unannotated protein n=1 Tax=freshwater metagenome TaxID=449393 RepID=A0A6J7PPN4_9ZZZZ
MAQAGFEYPVTDTRVFTELRISRLRSRSGLSAAGEAVIVVAPPALVNFRKSTSPAVATMPATGAATGLTSGAPVVVPG